MTYLETLQFVRAQAVIERGFFKFGHRTGICGIFTLASSLYSTVEEFRENSTRLSRELGPYLIPGSHWIGPRTPEYDQIRFDVLKELIYRCTSIQTQLPLYDASIDQHRVATLLPGALK